MLDNIGELLLAVSLLAIRFEFPTEFALRYMVPATAIGGLLGDLVFLLVRPAARQTRQKGRNTVTAIPLGFDTSSTCQIVFFVPGPEFSPARQAMPADEAAAGHAQPTCTTNRRVRDFHQRPVQNRLCVHSNWIRRLISRVGLLGSLVAIALVLISSYR